MGTLRTVSMPDVGARYSLARLLSALLVFFWLFRPQLFHPLGSSALLPAGGGLLILMLFPGVAGRVLQRLGPSFFALLGFILLWSLAIDLATGAFSRVGASSQFFAAARLVVGLAGAVFVVAALASWDLARLRGLLLLAVGIQVLIAIGMFASPELKMFMYQTVSGYTGSEKLFRERFLGARIYGWSEELFYLAPVAMTFITTLFARRAGPIWLLMMVVVLIVALFNARLGILGACFGLLIRFGVRAIVPLILGAMVLMLGLYLIAGPAVDVVLADIDGGGSRALGLLLDHHVHLLLRGDEWVFGSHLYLYGDPGRMHGSDIGWLIVLNYGGVIYLAAWVLLIAVLVVRAFPGSAPAMLAFLLFALVAIKGLAFSGNALVNVLLALALAGGYRGRKSFQPGATELVGRRYASVPV